MVIHKYMCMYTLYCNFFNSVKISGRCGQCEGCESQNCGQCTFCFDMPTRVKEKSLHSSEMST